MWRSVVLACVVFALLVFGEHQALAQTRDSLLNGAVIGAAAGAGAGVGIDALLNRASPGAKAAPPRVSIAPAVWRDLRGVVVKWRW